MSADRPLEILRAGCEILDPVMNSHGFRFALRDSDLGCAGYYANGDYVSGDRRLELHFMYSLGLVTYHVGDMSISHDAYLRALTKGAGGNQYPGFSDDPLDGFRHLAHDLQKFCDDFLSGDGKVLIATAQDMRAREENERKLDGHLWAREKARELLREKKYREVLDILENPRHPELMTGLDKKMLEIAKRNVQ
jgi:hypothetical protein